MFSCLLHLGYFGNSLGWDSLFRRNLAGRQDMHIRVWTGLGWTEEESEGYFLSSFYTNYLTALDG